MKTRPTDRTGRRLLLTQGRFLLRDEMPAVHAARPSLRPAWHFLLPAILGLAYACAHLAWYRHTPLGHGPVVDEQENLAFAEGIVRGELPREPFYRAGGYPLLLALLRVFGVPTGGLFTAALFLGAVLHALNAALVARIAGAWFAPRQPGTATAPGRSDEKMRPGAGAARGAALIAGLLYALNPVLIHYSTQALDAVPALTFFLLGLAAIARELTIVARASPPASSAPGSEHPCHAAWRWVLASVAWVAATLCRPNYLPAWCGLVLLAVVFSIRARTGRVAAAALAGVVCFAAFAGWQQRVSGVAALLPWQGTYNLWAANAPGAHGRYFVQRAAIPSALAQQNPTRLESIYLFRQETGRAPADHRELNAHWRRRFLERITRDPIDWLGQLGRKTYALLNDWEQYNNKTYAFHQARSPWLRWNPLGWGVVFVLGTAGFARLAADMPRLARRVALLAATLALSVLLFFVSARFRLPLAALATVLAGGALAAPQVWRPWSRRAPLLLAGGVAAAAAVTFSRFDHVRDRATFIMDHSLIAQVAFTIGDYDTAWREANAALELHPAHREALRVAVSAHFNRIVSGERAAEAEPRWLAAAERLLSQPANEERELRAVAAIALWRAGRRVDALNEWQNLGGTASAVAARLLLGDRSVSAGDLARAPAPLWDQPLVKLAAAALRIRPPAGVSVPDDPARAQAVIENLFGRRAP